MGALRQSTLGLLVLMGLVASVIILQWEREQPGAGLFAAKPAQISAAAPPAPSPSASSPPAPSPSAPSPPAATATVATSTVPSFDVVRVAPSGSAVLAGRAAPGADVTVRDGTTVIGRSTANPNGEWVLIPDEAMAPGGRALTLAARDPAGMETRAADSVVVVVPPRPVAEAPAAAPEPPVAVILPPQGPARVVQAAPGTALAMQQVDYDAAGAIRFAGVAASGAVIRFYIDGAVAGDAVADPTGKWAMTPPGAVAAGVHTLRLDQIREGGQIGAGDVLARIELPFQRDPVPVVATADAPVISRVVVQPGQSLWQLARSAYGEGTRYTIIYTANQGQIRDPNLIYPGQAFALPNQ